MEKLPDKSTPGPHRSFQSQAMLVLSTLPRLGIHHSWATSVEILASNQVTFGSATFGWFSDCAESFNQFLFFPHQLYSFRVGFS